MQQIDGGQSRCHRVADNECNNGYPAICFDGEERLWVAWTRADADVESVVVCFNDGPGFSDPFVLSGVTEVNYAPVLVAEDSGGVWCMWSVKEKGKWRVVARCCRSGKWMAEERVSESREPSSEVDAAALPGGGVVAVWECLSKKEPGIYLSRHDGERWSAPEGVSREGQLCFRPSVAVGGEGEVWVAWDGFVDGRWRVHLRRVGEERVLEVPTLSGRDCSDAHLAVDAEGDPWVAYVSYSWQPGGKKRDERVGSDPSVQVACLQEGKWVAPISDGDLAPGFVKANATKNHYPRLRITPSGMHWLFWQGLDRHLGWAIYAKYYRGGEWSNLMRFDITEEYDVRPQADLDKQGRIWVAHEGGMRFQNRGIYVRRLEGYATCERFVRAELVTPASELEPPELDDEPGPRLHADIGGCRYRNYIGNLHVQTILSDGHVGTPDQFYTFGRERHRWDFAAVTDHCDSNKLLPCEYALIQLAGRTFNDPPHFLAIPGWEWTQGDYGKTQYGHKCILFPTANGPVCSPLDGLGRTPKELAECLRGTGGLMSAHHIAREFSGGTNWDFVDAEVEPNLEICSNWGRFEYFGNPVGIVEVKHVAEKPGCSAQDALARGHRLGFIGGSDSHDFCHTPCMGITGAWLGELTREELFASLRNRMVYATTGEKVAILFRVGEAFTGSVVGAKEGVREIRADLAAAERIAKIELVRNGEVIDSEGFSSENVSYTFAEGADWSSVEPIASPSGEKLVYYYIRVSLAGGGMAWSSPVWLVLQAG
jgi:hypothetical protein